MKNPCTHGLAASALAATAALAGVITAAPASASTATGGLSTAATAAKPGVKISGSPAAWHPASVTVKPKNFTTCTRSKVTWTITNKTKSSQTISWQVGSGAKKTLGTVAAGEEVGICSQGGSGTKETFYLKGSASKLAVTLS